MNNKFFDRIGIESFEKLIFDSQEDEWEEIKRFSKRRINIAIKLAGYKKTGLYQEKSLLYQSLAKYMDDKWGLSQFSIKNFVNGKFAKDRNQFIDFMYGITDFFNLNHVKDIFVTDDKTFEKIILERREQQHRTDTVQEDGPPVARSQKTHHQAVEIPPVRISRIATLKGIIDHIISSKWLWTGALVTILVCFFGNIVICQMSGTLIGNDPHRIYFLKDLPSFINYLVICPAYVGLNLILIDNYLKINQLMLLEKSKAVEFSFRNLKNLLEKFAILAFLITLIILHYNEMNNPKTYSKLYWYIADVSESGERIFGLIGFFYMTYSSILLMFFVCPIVMLIKFIFLAQTLVNWLRTVPVETRIVENLKEQLLYFSCSYLIMKLLVIVYMGNAYTWKMANPNQSFGYRLMVTVLTVIGLFIMPFFRQYLSTQIYKLAKLGLVDDDIHPHFVTQISYFLDALIIFNFVYIFLI